MSGQSVAAAVPVSMPVAVPRAAARLGAAGALPFLAAAVAVWLVPSALALIIADAAALYGAVILSFVAGAHWGFACRADPPSGSLLALSVVPSLVGWAAVVQPSTVVALVSLAAMFVLVLAIDGRAVRTGAAPAWWLHLRRPLSLTVAGLQAATAAAVAAATP